MVNQERWKGRHPDKDVLRRRVWQALEDGGVAVGSPWSAIPNFVGASEAADRLCHLDVWHKAKVVKCNPDAAQARVRLNALEQGKRVYTPVPELVKDFPFVLLDPEALSRQNISFHDVMYSDGAVQLGQPIDFKDIEPIDFFVVGSVAVSEAGARTGKGAGFADLELGIFEYFGTVSAQTPVVTTVHDIQVVSNDELVVQAHDNAINIIATPGSMIETTASYQTPCPIDWPRVQPDQYRDIPFLAALRESLESRS